MNELPVISVHDWFLSQHASLPLVRQEPKIKENILDRCLPVRISVRIAENFSCSTGFTQVAIQVVDS